MQSYFPYSQIINIAAGSGKQNIVRHAFFGEWFVIDSENVESTTTKSKVISEIYY